MQKTIIAAVMATLCGLMVSGCNGAAIAVGVTQGVLSGMANSRMSGNSEFFLYTGEVTDRETQFAKYMYVGQEKAYHIESNANNIRCVRVSPEKTVFYKEKVRAAGESTLVLNRDSISDKFKCEADGYFPVIEEILMVKVDFISAHNVPSRYTRYLNALPDPVLILMTPFSFATETEKAENIAARRTLIETRMKLWRAGFDKSQKCDSSWSRREVCREVETLLKGIELRAVTAIEDDAAMAKMAPTS